MSERTVYIALGSNLGDRRGNIENALAALAAEQVEIVQRSSLYETAPRDVLDQPWFLNMVAECRTRDFPLQLLARLLRIERELGRDRSGASIPRGPRKIDLDILLFGDAVIAMPRLIVPHPRMLERRFVLEPLAEIAPDLRHPVSRELLASALDKVRDQKIEKLAED
jgi:2-amino-4-hydroxy-6-hydroxymethyldihydropteridine diphosphokinase